MMAQVESSTLFTVTKTIYLKERRSQIIACDCLKDLKTLYKLLEESIDRVKYGLYCPTLARDDPSIMFCYIPVKVRKLLDMGLLIKMILSASARFFKTENPTVEDLIKDVKLAAPPKFNLERVRLMYSFSPAFLEFLGTQRFKNVLLLAGRSVRFDSSMEAYERALNTDRQAQT